MPKFEDLLVVSPGLCKGQIKIVEAEGEIVIPTHGPLDFESEKTRFLQVIAKIQEGFKEDSQRDDVAQEIHDLLEAYNEILEDPSLIDDIETSMKKGSNLEQAVEYVYEETANDLASLEDEYFAQRAHDIRDLKAKILRRLLQVPERDLKNLDANTILVADEITPAESAKIDFKKVVGIVTEKGSKTAHISLIAQALKLPAIVGVDISAKEWQDGTVCLFNGNARTIILSPSSEDVASFDEQYAEWKEREKHLELWRSKPAQTSDGAKTITLLANVGNLQDSENALEENVKQIGLLRTEFLYMYEKQAPNEEQLFDKLNKMTEGMEASTIRLLDIGGDKEVPYLKFAKEENPFLGFRGIRFLLEEQHILKTQIRACLRLNEIRKIQLMIPMIVSVDRFLAVKAMVDKEKINLGTKNDMDVGIMVETPASAIMIDGFIRAGIDFISIGTNDLIQYTACCDRGNQKVANFYNHYRPAVLRLIKRCVTESEGTKVSVSICGEMGGDHSLTALLVGMGLTKLSMGSAKANSIKEVLNRYTFAECEKLANAALQAVTDEEVKSLCENF